MALPTTTIEMTRTGNSAEPPLIIRQPVTLEPKIIIPSARPKAPFRALTDATRGHIIAMLAEFFGTTMFLFFGFVAAQTGNEKADITLRASLGLPSSPPGPSLIQISYISAIFGLSLAINGFVWYRVSGGMFNPSIAFGLWLAGAFDWKRLLCVLPAQFLGGITAAALVSTILPRALQAENSLGPGVSVGQGLAMETVLTSMLMITILMLAVEKHRASFMAPLVIGIALMIIHLAGINISGASVNPARTLGPALVNGNYVPEIWIYFVGPTLGATIAAGVHWLMTALAYQTANPGQDGDGMEYYRILPPSSPPRSSSSSFGNINTSSYSKEASFANLPRTVITRVPPGGSPPPLRKQDLGRGRKGDGEYHGVPEGDGQGLY